MDLNKVKNEKGITLIALAVTIVVLLILAGVTISSVFSENGIIKKAQEAENAIEKAKYNDLSEIAELEKQINEYTGATINEEEYATLNLNTYFGKHHRQKCDYLRMYVELSNQDDENEKVTFAVGTDWKENITVESENKLFYTKYAQMELIQDLSFDNYYQKDNTTISSETVNAFTNVVISNLKIKKGNNYNVKLFIQAATWINYVATPYMVEAYTGSTNQITDEVVNINIEKANIKNYRKIFEINGNGGSTLALDRITLSDILNYQKDKLPVYTAYTSSGNSYKIKPFLNEKGEVIDSDYIGLDINRDGYLSEEDSQIIASCAASGGSEW